MTNIICITCPKGCHLSVDENNDYAVTGNACPRGEIYGKNELKNPVRVVTSTVRVEDHINKQVVRAEVPGYVDLLVTVQSDRAALGSDAVVLDGGYNLRVNTNTYIKGEGYMASGPIMFIEREGQ